MDDEANSSSSKSDDETSLALPNEMGGEAPIKQYLSQFAMNLQDANDSWDKDWMEGGQ